MRCPACHQHASKVVDSRRQSQHITRRRECLKCQHRWTTLEIAQTQIRPVPPRPTSHARAR